ncbi:MAG: PAS domain-containing sensor histidine kinase [Methanobacteriota archaeon]
MRLCRLTRYPSHDINSRRILKQVVSRLGPVLQAEYVSFLEFSYNEGEICTITEEALWSYHYGFLIGELSDGDSPGDVKNFQEFLLTLKENSHASYNRKNAHEIFQKMMIHRDVTDILVLPVQVGINPTQIQACLVLWDNINRWTDLDITSLHIITDCISTYLTRIRLETDLERCEEKFKGVIEYIGDMYYLTDKSGSLLEISPSMVASLGYVSTKSLIGKNMQDFLKNPDIWPLFLSEILTGNGVKDYELIFEGYHGKIITGSVSCRLVYDKEGDLHGIEGVIRDISRRRQYEQMVQESEWKHNQAQKIAKLGVWSFDSSTNLFRVSSEIFSILVIPAETSQITLDDLVRMTAPPDKVKVSNYFDSIDRQGHEFEFEFKLDLNSNKFKHIRMKGQPRIRDGMVTGSFGIIQDITERKEVENHLLRYASQLEQKTLEMDAMRIQLLDMNRELDQRVRLRTKQIEELLHQKDEFIMQIGHDLKTPLTPLVAILPYIRSKETNPELCELLDVSIDDVSTIRKMITTVLELAQMNALYTISDLKMVNLRTSIDQIISGNAYLIHQKSLNVINEIPDFLTLMISPMHLETLVGNIISNAVKYSYINGEVRLSAYEHKDSVIIVIKDQGIGMEPDVIPRIFDAFYRVDSSRHDSKSHGLGLAIAQRVAEIYKGVIKVESQGIGKGTTFSIQLKKNPPLQGFSDTENKKKS